MPNETVQVTEQAGTAVHAAQAPGYVNYGGKGIGAYEESESWDNYVARLTGHLDACNVRNVSQRRDILISTVGAQTYSLDEDSASC